MYFAILRLSSSAEAYLAFYGYRHQKFEAFTVNKNKEGRYVLQFIMLT